MAHASKKVSRVENPEDEPVALLPVFAQQGGEVLHCRCLYGQVAAERKVFADYAEDMVSAKHLCRREVACALWDGRFLGHVRIDFPTKI
jgi:hypothetical protein